MSAEHSPKDAISIRVGRIRVDITGPLVIGAVLLALAVAAAGRAFGFW